MSNYILTPIDRQTVQNKISEFFENLEDDDKESKPIFEKYHFSGDLRGLEELKKCIFKDCSFEGAILDRETIFALREAGVTNFDVIKANDTDLSSIIRFNREIGEMIEKPINLSDCTAEGADFSNSDLTRAILDRCKLKNAKFNGARINKISLYEADIAGAEFFGAKSTEEGLSKILAPAKNAVEAKCDNPDKDLNPKKIEAEKRAYNAELKRKQQPSDELDLMSKVLISMSGDALDEIETTPVAPTIKKESKPVATATQEVAKPIEQPAKPAVKQQKLSIFAKFASIFISKKPAPKPTVSQTETAENQPKVTIPQPTVAAPTPAQITTKVAPPKESLITQIFNIFKPKKSTPKSIITPTETVPTISTIPSSTPTTTPTSQINKAEIPKVSWVEKLTAPFSGIKSVKKSEPVAPTPVMERVNQSNDQERW
jgi:uncharacterized protein YjbI with pentapeptide repeats